MIILSYVLYKTLAAAQETLYNSFIARAEFALAETRNPPNPNPWGCLLYTSDAADERSSVDLGGRRIIKKKNNKTKQY